MIKNSVHKQNGKPILNENIEFPEEVIELKDIESVTLYKKEGNDVIKVKELDINNFNAQDYIVQIKMKDMVDFYAEIKSGRIDNDNFMLELKYNNAVSYDGNVKSNTITVNYGKVQNNIVKDISFDDVINTIKNNPTAEITLTHDLDAASIKSKDNSMITTEFKGKLNGNGYSIKNLKKSLFNSTNGADIKNLIIDNATLKNSQGILSNSINNTTIHNVHIKNSSILVGSWQTIGAFTGISTGKLLIENSSISNTTIKE
ncbi:ZmpA/ZmpB/ZmpC family metallo-endopeptidase-related protein [Clostridium niameyense]|uniref:ZmpA/ZmpB/ZmpC family metallo-endopeptidase-related protein n=1 Tax=Clostridium niameyense TaxID=1622073 RepID=UPI00067F5EE0|nr:ZmpA/ZmpB/ZmpC family metallo-endopeptidase-related protein [Clostridium niameyense]